MKARILGFRLFRVQGLGVQTSGSGVRGLGLRFLHRLFGFRSHRSSPAFVFRGVLRGSWDLATRVP